MWKYLVCSTKDLKTYKLFETDFLFDEVFCEMFSRDIHMYMYLHLVNWRFSHEN